MELDLLVSLVRSNDLVVADEVSSALNDIILLKLVKYSSNQTDLPLSLRRQVAEREERLCLEELQRRRIRRGAHECECLGINT